MIKLVKRVKIERKRVGRIYYPKITGGTSVHHETVAILESIFRTTGISRLSTVMDICPGDDPKVELAFRNTGFEGSVIAVDASLDALDALRIEAGKLPFRFITQQKRLEDLEPGCCDVMVGTHIIDDLALLFYALKNESSYEELYFKFRQDPVFSRRTWIHIANDNEIKNRIVNLLCEIAKKTKCFILAQYPSKYERLHAMEHETRFCVDTLHKIADRLLSKGEFSREELPLDLLARSEVHKQEHWLVLRKIETDFPSLGLKLTERCNLSCSQCCAFTTTNRDMDPTIIRKIARQFNGTKISLTGGEPFLYPHLKEILELAARDVELTIVTNGTILKEEIFEILKKIRIKVKVSILGTKQIHDAITGVQGTFDKAVQTIKELIRMGIRVEIQSNLHAENVNCAERLVELCKETDVDELRVYQLIQQGKALGDRWKDARLSETAFEDLTKRMKRRATEIGWGGNIRARNWENDGQYVLILPSGEVTAGPVENKQGYAVIGNLTTQSLPEIWTTYPFKDAHHKQYGKST